MRRLTLAFQINLTVFLGFFCAGCTYNTPATPIFNVTQEQLDAATILSAKQDTTILGDPFNGFGTDTLTTKHKMRDLFANVSLPADPTIGTVMVRRAYYYSGTEYNRDSLINIVVMVKREEGYYPEGGDWEYMDIKYDKSTNYTINPNGVLPEANTTIRGQITKCANCHARAGSNFLFHGNQ